MVASAAVAWRGEVRRLFYLSETSHEWGMKLTHGDIQEFKRIYREEFGAELSDAAVKRRRQRLAVVYKTVKPNPTIEFKIDSAFDILFEAVLKTNPRFLNLQPPDDPY